ncbi:hypothetical protein DIPPA_19453 [Diplonema papillatum]|nr:hypothetical protein DIPPA_19453 [Diplonema papillatum]
MHQSQRSPRDDVEMASFSAAPRENASSLNGSFSAHLALAPVGNANKELQPATEPDATARPHRMSPRQRFKEYLTRLKPLTPAASSAQAASVPKATSSSRASPFGLTLASAKTFHQTHGSASTARRSNPYAPPVNMGVNTDPVTSLNYKSFLLWLFMLLQLLTSIFCYVQWFRHQRDDLSAAVNAYVAFMVLGLIIFFGIVTPVLLTTLSGDVAKAEVRRKRFFSVFVLWLAHDLAIFIVEFVAFIEVGLVDFYQILSFCFSVVAGTIPPWYVYLRVTTDFLHATYAVRAPSGLFMQPPEAHHLLLRQPSNPEGFGDIRTAEANEPARAFRTLTNLHIQLVSQNPGLTKGQLAAALRKEIASGRHSALEQNVMSRYVANTNASDPHPAAVSELQGLVSQSQNPISSWQSGAASAASGPPT